ncbi:hypothetical protein HWV62_39067 [Athelia sp. TMB]|nr:hypothetical protein HWV62_39067 [Athelia sp. TMB]
MDRKLALPQTQALNQPAQRRRGATGTILWRVAAAALAAGVWTTWTLRGHHTVPGALEGSPDKFDWYALPSSENIEWTTCFKRFKCARLRVPLDWERPEGPKAEIALQLLPATDKDSYKGTILLNPGGPGGAGTAMVHEFGEKIAKITGPEFDLLGFDPRGTGATLPRAECFNSLAESQIWDLQRGLVMNLSDQSIPLARSRAKVLGARCRESLDGNGEAGEWASGQYMGTASVTADMLRIVEKLGQDKLQYWGISYGSVLGQYFAAMYPEKVGRVVIDGILDAYEYQSTQGLNLPHIDAIFGSFFELCHRAGPEKCILWAPDALQIQNRVFAILSAVDREPMPVPFAPKGPTVITMDMLHTIMFTSTYQPIIEFPALARILVALEARNGSALAAVPQLFHAGATCECSAASPWAQLNNEAMYAIMCGDATIRPEHDFTTFFTKLSEMSPFFAPVWALHHLQCTEWQLSAKWKHAGPFSADRTAHPLLILASTLDNVTPLKFAQAVQKRYAGAALLVQNSIGHSTFAAPSLCTARAIRAYFGNGTLPREAALCEVDELPFIGDTTVNASDRGLSAEDADLLDTLKFLSRQMPALHIF